MIISVVCWILVNVANRAFDFTNSRMLADDSGIIFFMAGIVELLAYASLLGLLH